MSLFITKTSFPFPRQIWLFAYEILTGLCKLKQLGLYLLCDLLRDTGRPQFPHKTYIKLSTEAVHYCMALTFSLGVQRRVYIFTSRHFYAFFSSITSQ